MHTRASPDEIDPREAAAGQNFIIDIQNRNLQLRPPFDLVGTVPNGLSINGAASFVDSSGVTHAGFQAGGQFYKWDGTTFTAAGTCSATCKLRGHWRTHTWNLTNKVLITDLNQIDPIYEWDGTTGGIKQTVFTDQNSNPFGAFYARYLSITNERAVFANVRDTSGPLPQMIVGCETSNYNEISVVNAPSSSLGTSDPFFLISPDIKPINCFLETYLGAMISTEKGEIFNLTGTDATNFAFATFYSASAASGRESVCEIGNDFIYGRQGRIESVRDTNTFGNSQGDDITAIIADQVSDYTGWTIVFNGRTRRAFCFPSGVSQCWVLDAAIRDARELTGQGLSPWMVWTTSHPMAFMPTMVMSMLDPVDGLEYVFMGDASGNIYRMEGTGASGDGGTSTINLQFLSKLISARLDSEGFDFEGYVKYVQQPTASTLNLTFAYQGEKIFNAPITMTLPASPTGHFYSGSGSYYSAPGVIYNEFSGKMTRNKFSVPGNPINEFQILTEVIGNNPVAINEIGIRFIASS